MSYFQTTWPQWAVIFLWIIKFALIAKENKKNVIIWVINLLMIIGMATLLYFGGFWKVL